MLLLIFLSVDGDARNEVLTQLAKVPFPGASLSETRAFQEMERQSGEGNFTSQILLTFNCCDTYFIVYRVTGRTMELGTRKPSKSQSSKLDVPYQVNHKGCCSVTM